MSKNAIMQYAALLLAPMMLSQIPGAAGRVRPAFNVVVSNVPGPEKPLYFRGWRLEAIYPLSIPFHGYGLNITVSGYAGRPRLRLHRLPRHRAAPAAARRLRRRGGRRARNVTNHKPGASATGSPAACTASGGVDWGRDRPGPKSARRQRPPGRGRAGEREPVADAPGSVVAPLSPRSRPSSPRTPRASGAGSTVSIFCMAMTPPERLADHVGDDRLRHVVGARDLHLRADRRAAGSAAATLRMSSFDRLVRAARRA